MSNLVLDRPGVLAEKAKKRADIRFRKALRQLSGKFQQVRVNHSYYANDNDSLIPERWANESVAILVENMVMGGLVHRDFEPSVSQFGDIVNTRKPADFVGERKTDDDEVTTQDASAPNIPVPLNQWVHVSFIIKDGERSKAFKDLVDFYLRPAIIANASFIDKCVAGQVYQFRSNIAGNLGLISSNTIQQSIVDTRKKLNQLKCPEEGRRLVITPTTEAAALMTGLFVSAEQVGDDGTALREASLGKKFGFSTFHTQNMSDVAYLDVTNTTINDAAVVLGTTTFTATASHGIVVGSFLKVAGDGQPQLVTAVSTNAITISPGFNRTVPANGAAIVNYLPGTVNQSVATAGYAAGYAKGIICDAFSTTNANKPQVGQLVQFGTSSTVSATAAQYSIVRVTNGASDACTIYLDRPLAAAVVDDAIISVGPSGQYNFAFVRNAVALVNRPLAPAMSGTGALSASAVMDNLSLRVTITYDGKAQGHRVTVDGLFGFAKLDNSLGCVMLG